MKIVTFNVNSIRMRMDQVLAWLDRTAPDVVCLQEIKVTEEKFPALEFLERGYRAEVFGQPTYNGVAILSREEIAKPRRGLDDGEARLIAGTVAGIRVVNVYVPNGRKVGSEAYGFKLDWLDRLADVLREEGAPDVPLVLCGDFNIAPEDRDTYDPEQWRGKILCSEPEREKFRNLIELGLRDAGRLYTLEPGFYTWWDYRQGMFPRNQGLRIDHHLITRPLVGRLDEVAVDRDIRAGEKPSDHAPVVMTLD